MSTGAVVGIVISALVVVAVVLPSAYALMLKKTRSDRLLKTYQEGPSASDVSMDSCDPSASEVSVEAFGSFNAGASPQSAAGGEWKPSNMIDYYIEVNRETRGHRKSTIGMLHSTPL